MPKAVHKKKRFIDPKKDNTTTFALIHRSQKDPLAADPDAPQRLLQALPSKPESRKRKDEERELGVFYDDDYDYLQHLKSRDEFFEANLEEVEKFTIEAKSVKKSSSSKVKLPEEVLASKDEEEIGLLNKAAPRRGPLFDWDPDIVETLDDEFNHDMVFTLKDEENEEGDEKDLDFILDEAQKEKSNQEDSEDDYDDYDSDEALDDVPSLDGGFSNFSDEETKSRFTQYSMSSSVIRRNEGLTMLDDRFEKFFEDYDDENLGGLEMDEVEGYKNANSDVMKQILSEYKKQQETKRVPLEEDLRKGIDAQEVEIGSEDEKEVIEMEGEEVPEDKFDCESILSTYSNIYNHPKMITERSIKPIKVSGKTGIPKDVLGKGLTSAALKQLDRMNAMQEINEDQELETMTLASRVSELSFRNKHESKEEKKARKLAVKEHRRERRVEKKLNQDAFKEEKYQQEKNAINLRTHCNQAIKLL